MTLKKIDEIEAQMSKQWWKGRQVEASVHGPILPGAVKPPVTVDSAPVSLAGGERTKTFAPTQPSELGLDVDPAQATDYEPTQMGLPAAADSGLTAGPQQVRAPLGIGGGNFDTGSREFSTSALFSI